MRGGNPGEGGSMVAGWNGRARLVAASGMPAARSAALVAVWRDRRVAALGVGIYLFAWNHKVIRDAA